MYQLLQGVRIIDVTSVVFGPLGVQILADLGAEVIKVESPEGDVMRAVPPHAVPGVGPGFANCNRNKRCIALDLKTDGGKDVLKRLLRNADVLIHNMRQSAFDRLGFDFEAVKAINPNILYCAAVGFGSAGPFARRPAYDDIIQAESGLAGSHLQRDGQPALAPGNVADKVGALHIAYAVAAALFHRQRSGCGALKIEVPMFEALASFVMCEHLGAATFEAGGATGYHRTMSANRRPYRTKDGWIGVLPYTGAQWRRILALIGREDVAGAPWFADAAERSRRSSELYGVLHEATPSRTTADWLREFDSLDIPCAPVNTTSDLLTNEHLNAVGFFEPNFDRPTPMLRVAPQAVIYHGAEIKKDLPPEQLGQSSEALLHELGYEGDEIDALLSAGAVKTA